MLESGISVSTAVGTGSSNYFLFKRYASYPRLNFWLNAIVLEIGINLFPTKINLNLKFRKYFLQVMPFFTFFTKTF